MLGWQGSNIRGMRHPKETYFMEAHLNNKNPGLTHHHPSNGTASHMTNSTTDGDATSSCCHLLHQAWLLGLGHCRWRSSHWCRRRGRSCPWSRSWWSSSHWSSRWRRCCPSAAGHFHSDSTLCKVSAATGNDKWFIISAHTQ